MASAFEHDDLKQAAGFNDVPKKRTGWSGYRYTHSEKNVLHIARLCRFFRATFLKGTVLSNSFYAYCLIQGAW
jgi:hypothetical protein